jgi:hypothetical protein
VEMDFATTLAALDEIRGQEVLVAIDRFEGSFKPQLVSQGVLGGVRMVPEITDTGAAIDHRGEDLPLDQKTWERGVAFFPIGEADDDAFADGPAGFYLNPAEFDHGSHEGSAIRLFLGDLTICLETAE